MNLCVYFPVMVSYPVCIPTLHLVLPGSALDHDQLEAVMENKLTNVSGFSSQWLL